MMKISTFPAAVMIAIVVMITVTFAGCDKPRSGYTGRGNPNQGGAQKPTRKSKAAQQVQADLKAQAEKKLLKPIETVKNSIGMEMVLVPAGKFQMGSPTGEKGHQPGEYQREVTIDKPFHISAHEVTQKQYAALMGDNPSGFVGENRPVENVSWNEAVAFCEMLSKQEEANYRLPIEAEWEYACRAGSTSVFHYGDALTFVQAAIDGRYPYNAKIKGSLLQETKKVGSYPPNSLGLYDMHGNVSEWCIDTLFNSGDSHISRGGCGLSAPIYARSAYRNSIRGQGWQWNGFRVVKTDDPSDFEIPVAPPLNRHDKFSVDELITKIDEALARPAIEHLEPVIIFPVVNDKFQATPEGIGLGHLAAYATVCLPERRMNVCLPRLRYLFRQAGCYQFKPARTLDRNTMRVCLSSMEAKRFIVPELIKRDKEWILKLSLKSLAEPADDTEKAIDTEGPESTAELNTVETDDQTDDSEEKNLPEKEKTEKENPPQAIETAKTESAAAREISNATEITRVEIKLTPQQIAEIPGLIATHVLKGIDAQLTDAEWKAIETPQVASAEDINQMGNFVADYAFGEENKTLMEFLERNPQSVAGWMMYCFDSYPSDEVVKRWETDKKIPRHDRLAIATHVRRRGELMTQESLLDLLERAPRYKTDTYFFAAIYHNCKALNHPKLLEHASKVWRQYDESYAGKLLRGINLIDAAWDARGSSWGSNVSEEGWRKFEERLLEAQTELEEAIDVNPLAWQAHSQLLTVCKGLGLPRTYAGKHFNAAVDIHPRSVLPYSKMYQLLQLRWGGTAQELLSLAQRAIDEGAWETGIPDIARSVVNDLTTEPVSHAVFRSAYAEPAIWKVVQSYYQSALKSDHEDWIKYATNYFAKSGGYARKWKEVAPVFEQLEKEGTDERIFWDGFTYSYLRDRAFADQAEGQKQIVAKLRLALDNADFDEADKQLSLLKPADNKETDERDRYQRIIALGRQLEKERKITLTGSQILETFYGVDSKWSKTGSQVIWNGLPETKTTITFPFGLKRARISGLARWANRPDSIQFPLHTRSHRDLVFLKYETKRTNNIKLLRAKSRVKVDRLGDSEAQFRFTFGAEEDIIEPIPELTWTIPVFEDEPSSFAIRLESGEKRSLVSIKELMIELLD